jgi:hypothetical protein
MLTLAERAGGDAPLPPPPDAQMVRDLQQLSGNQQLLSVVHAAPELKSRIVVWTDAAGRAKARLPRWQCLQELAGHAGRIPETLPVQSAMQAIEVNRSLLGDPDPVPTLIQSLVDLLRTALNTVQTEAVATFNREHTALLAHPSWAQLSQDQRDCLAATYDLQPTACIAVGTEDEVLSTLEANSLANRQVHVQALPERFRKALAEAAHILEPKASTYKVVSVTLKSEADLKKWLDGVAGQVREQLKKGPVVVN